MTGDDDLPCGCSCHYMPGVMHVVPCCAAPPFADEDEVSDDPDVIERLTAQMAALTEKTEQVSARLREATERKRQLNAKIQAHLDGLPAGVRVYRSRWEREGFGFFTGSNVAEKSDA